MNVNSNARDQIFSNIRSALSQMPKDRIEAITQKYAEMRNTRTPTPVVDGILVDRFIEKHAAVHGTFELVSNYSQIPKAVESFLIENELPAKFVTGKTEFIKGIDWPQHWEIDHRSANQSDLTSVTDVVCAIAETGTIVICSSPQASSTHLFLPENHIVIFDAGQIVRHLDDALQIGTENILQKSRGFHMITGPSKTADVEQTIQYGAHGPRRLHAVIIDAL